MQALCFLKLYIVSRVYYLYIKFLLMSISEIDLYDILSEKLGREQAKALTEYVELKAEKHLNDKTSVFATKKYLANAKVDIIKWVFGFFTVLISAVIGLYFK